MNTVSAPSRSNQQPDLGLPSARVIPLCSFFEAFDYSFSVDTLLPFSSVVLISHLPGFTNLLFSAHDPIGFGKPLFYLLIHTWCL